MDIRVVMLSAFTVAGIRAYGPYSVSAPEAWNTLAPWLARMEKSGAELSYWGIMHDDIHITQPDKIRYDAMVAVPADLRLDGSVFARRMDACEYAMAEHKGPYHEVQAIWLSLFWDWLPFSGRCPATLPCLEQYMGNPVRTPSALLTTRLYLPLAPL
ncbi:GyrI-like domain-containing protein [Oleidesulfovibrio alaskensis]|jgi:DNA gyrase inhibitor GyrI